MSTKEKPPHWIDHLAEKHECFPYGETRTLSVTYDGREISLVAPRWVANVTPLAVAPVGEVLMLLGQLDKIWDKRPLGVMLVAQQKAADQYEVVVWHELYPYALERLGLSPAQK